MRGIGDVLRHAYPDVQPEQIWDVATTHIRPLKACVVDALLHTRDVSQAAACSLLIGAGCSATTGVETAAGFVR